MDEHGRFDNNADDPNPAFEENAELLRRETAEEMLAQTQSRSNAKQISDPKDSKSVSKAKTAAKSAGKGKKQSKPAEKETEKSPAGNKRSSGSGEPGSAKKTGKSGSGSAKQTGGSKTAAKKTADNEPSGKNRGKKSISERLASELTDEKPSSVKKRAAKRSEQTAEPVTDDQQTPDDGANRASCKTPQVMKLIEDDSDELVIYAGKSRVPKLLRGRESLSRLSRRSAAENETEVVNITELVIKHEAADILDRFNACSCETCVQVFSEMISQRIPVRYARISRSELELDGLPERAVPMRKIVLPEMIRELICNKKRSFHDK